MRSSAVPTAAGWLHNRLNNLVPSLLNAIRLLGIAPLSVVASELHAVPYGLKLTISTIKMKR